MFQKILAFGGVQRLFSALFLNRAVASTWIRGVPRNERRHNESGIEHEGKSITLRNPWPRQEKEEKKKNNEGVYNVSSIDCQCPCGPRRVRSKLVKLEDNRVYLGWGGA